ncbi:hypothetical protein Q5P01_008876 [Channa striata]|uniref:Uncharacterized protein n=1 Tax=Channa striata TaxID=64152 RepID=A0AA88N0E4_CHASR|nr:hypothetical protein Q5P01_008876 [Channa striata]
MHLQQCWHELKERELAAQQQNRELLQQFEKAQDTLREMVACNAAMKTIRIEYEQYLDERYPRWQQQLKEKTQAAKALRMEECLKSRLDIREGGFSTQRHLHSQGPTNKPQNVAATQDYNQKNHLDNNQDAFSHLPYIQSSWLTHPQSQTFRLPMRVPCQPQASSHFPPSYHPHPFDLHHLTSTTSHPHLWPRQDAPSGASLHSDCPWFWTAGANGLPSGSGAIWGQLYTEEPLLESRVSQDVAQERGTSRAQSTKSGRGDGSRSSHLSQELDVKPVRLSSDHTESSESGRGSSQALREKRTKREKRRRSQCTSSEKERHSEESPSTTNITSVAVHCSESDTLSEKCSTGRIKKTRRCGGQAKESQVLERTEKEGTRNKKDNSGSRTEESQCLSQESKTEKAGSQSADNKSESGTEGPKGKTTESENRGRDEIKKPDSSSSEQSSANEEEEEKGHKNQEVEDGEDDNAKEKENSQEGEKLEEEDLEEEDDDNEEKENSLREEEQEEEEDKDVSENTFKGGTEAEDGVAEEYEDNDRMKNVICESSASSQNEEVDEDEIEKDKEKTEDEEGSDEEEDGDEEEQRGDKAGIPEDESDSEQGIILSQDSRHTKMDFIPEEERRDSKTGSSEDHDSSDFNEEDIERLLAPQDQKRKEEKDLNDIEKPKAICESMKLFQVEEDRSTKTDHQSNTDEEFDHFYD